MSVDEQGTPQQSRQQQIDASISAIVNGLIAAVTNPRNITTLRPTILRMFGQSVFVVHNVSNLIPIMTRAIRDDPTMVQRLEGLNIPDINVHTSRLSTLRTQERAMSVATETEEQRTSRLAQEDTQRQQTDTIHQSQEDEELFAHLRHVVGNNSSMLEDASRALSSIGGNLASWLRSGINRVTMSPSERAAQRALDPNDRQNRQAAMREINWSGFTLIDPNGPFTANNMIPIAMREQAVAQFHADREAQRRDVEHEGNVRAAEEAGDTTRAQGLVDARAAADAQPTAQPEPEPAVVPPEQPATTQTPHQDTGGGQAQTPPTQSDTPPTPAEDAAAAQEVEDAEASGDVDWIARAHDFLEMLLDRHRRHSTDPSIPLLQERQRQLEERRAEQRAEADRAGARALRDPHTVASEGVTLAQDKAITNAVTQLGGAAGSGAAARVAAEQGYQAGVNVHGELLQDARNRQEEWEQKEVDRRQLAAGTEDSINQNKQLQLHRQQMWEEGLIQNQQNRDLHRKSQRALDAENRNRPGQMKNPFANAPGNANTTAAHAQQEVNDATTPTPTPTQPDTTPPAQPAGTPQVPAELQPLAGGALDNMVSEMARLLTEGLDSHNPNAQDGATNRQKYNAIMAKLKAAGFSGECDDALIEAMQTRRGEDGRPLLLRTDLVGIPPKIDFINQLPSIKEIRQRLQQVVNDTARSQPRPPPPPGTMNELRQADEIMNAASRGQAKPAPPPGSTAEFRKLDTQSMQGTGTGSDRRVKNIISDEDLKIIESVNLQRRW